MADPVKSNQILEAVCYLTACALAGEAPKPDGYAEVSGEDLFKLSSDHSIETILAVALEENGYAGIDESVRTKFQDALNAAIRKNMLMDAEREEILVELEKEKICYMPLKGVLLQNMYPMYGMRQMSDNDILCDPDRRKDVRKVMETRGYSVDMFGHRADDGYKKVPMYHFEMHTSLFNKVYEKLEQGYRNVWEKLIPDEPGKYGYHFSDSDFYVYVIAHAVRHLGSTGTGLRSLTDIVVMERNLPELDREYVADEMERLGIADEARKMSNLAEKVFCTPSENSDKRKNWLDGLSVEERKLLLYMSGSGTFGTLENSVRNEMMESLNTDGHFTRGQKIKYVLRRIFPTAKTIRQAYPSANNPFLFPFVYIGRLIVGPFRLGRRMFDELRIIRKA